MGTVNKKCQKLWKFQISNQGLTPESSAFTHCATIVTSPQCLFFMRGISTVKTADCISPSSEYLLSTLWEILICCGERYYCLSFQVTSNTYLQLLKSMKCCCVCHPSLHAHAIPPVLLVICLMSGLMCSDRIKEWACAPKCTLCNN